MPPAPGAAPGEAASAPQEVVGRAVQDLAARRLGRGFLPLGLLCLAGLVRLVLLGPGHPGAWALVLGAPVAGLAMLLHGVAAVQRAFGRPLRGWLRLAGPASLVPPAFGLYVLGWWGLRGLTRGEGASMAGAVLLAVLGGWALLGWLRVLELRRLAETMSEIGGGTDGWDG